MELVVGTHRINATLRRIPGGVEAELAGAALKRLIDATLGSGETIEVLGGDLDRHALDVADIRMAGAATTVTLLSMGAQTVH
ncbi:hypothetical protein [Paenirhodobacter sp. CAU 1674]|uniref:hypothetical protein n=1 Tax=Paenirhodobacter sp. CAU 1674 TaxID=3032596 RepID=UPI0023D9C913|nr:hypothetical protein [Paenirhodobacter sp. CAU 1674]MDF2142338.1 hypothetical protein [Paenirhodobacter sp. CAU 1674]